MLTKLKHQLEKLTNSKEFGKEGYFCSAFIMADFKDLNSQNWQLDFYNDKKDKITSYVVEPVIKKINDESDVYKEEKIKLNELKLDKDLIDFKKILDIANKELANSKEFPNKTIVVLQNDGKAVIWNLSFVTNNFNLINLRIEANSGKILDNKKVELLNWNSK